MRNLKRVLALAMALVMTLGMMVIGANAASYADNDQIDAKYSEAVAVLTGINVLRGQGADQFAPKANLTRAEAAAIIYRIDTLDVTDKQAGIYADYAKFDDVKTADWFAGYMGYCANAEFIKGYGDGKVGPNDPVTGYQILAMILRVMGYGQNGEFEGAGWDIRTASTAQKLGILKNISTSTLGSAATRETVAEMVFQAMLCSIVEYTPAFNYQETGLTLMDIFGAKKVAGVISDTTLAEGKTTLDNSYTYQTTNYRGVVTDHTINVTVSKTDADWTKVGYAAYVWVTGMNTTLGTAKAITDVVVTGTDLSVTTDGTVITNMMTTDKKAPNYVAAPNASGVSYYLNGEEQNTAFTAKVGMKVALVDNDGDGDIDAVVATEYTAGTVTNVRQKSVSGVVSDYSYEVDNLTTGSGSTTMLVDELVGVDALAQGDYITYVAINDDDTGADDYYYVTMADTTIGEFNSITWTTVGGTTKKAYTVDGAKYVASELTKATNYSYLNSNNLNDTVVVITDEYGYIIAAAEYVNPAAYLYVIDNDDDNQITGLAETKVAYVDGTIEVVDVKANVDDNDLVNEIYTYAVKNGAYTLTAKNAVTRTATHVANSIDFGSVKLSQKTIVVDLRDVLKGKATVGTVYTGYNELPAITDATITYLKDANTMTLGFLIDGTNTEDLRASFVVFNTAMNEETLAGNQHIYTLTAGVLIKGEVVPNYELSQTQADAIKTYGVGVYTFGTNGALASYTSFAEDDVIWKPETNGTVIYNGIDISSSYLHVFLDVSAGKVNEWDQYVTDGVYYAYLDKVNRITYIVADDTIAGGTILASTAGTSTELNGNLYWAADKKVTAYAPIVSAANNLYSLKVLGNTIDLATGEGLGTKESPIAYVVAVPTAELAGTVGTARLEVVDNYVGAEMELWNKDWTAKIGDQTGTGSIKDNGQAVSDGSKWNIVSDGVYYSVEIKEVENPPVTVSTVSALTDALANAVDGDTIVLNEGVYQLTGALSITKAITLKAADGANVELKAATGYEVIVANPVAGDTVTLEGLTFVSAASNHAIASASLGTVKVVDCTFTGNGYGIYVSDAASTDVLAIIDGCTFNNLNPAIGGIQKWVNVEITNNSFVSCGEAVGYVTTGAAGVDVLNTLIADGNTGVYASNVIGY